jgi:hypothetical protein
MFGMAEEVAGRLLGGGRIGISFRARCERVQWRNRDVGGEYGVDFCTDARMAWLESEKRSAHAVCAG